MGININLSECIAPHFYDLHHAIKNDKYTEYFLSGGRGSTKSSFIALEDVLNMYKDSLKGVLSNIVALRKVGETLYDSVYAKFVWAIDKLGLTDEFIFLKSPMKIILKKTGQAIYFRSCQLKQDHMKLKSFSPLTGFIKYVWFEELPEFAGMEEIRSIQQSLMRGTNEQQVCMFSFNPPKSRSSWVNEEKELSVDGRINHNSTYLTVDKDWLGKTFIKMADNLKKINPKLYEHEYLGETVDIGIEIFTNLKEFDSSKFVFSKILHGMDFGFVDPFSYVQTYYDTENQCVYIFDEAYGSGWSNKEQTSAVKNLNKTNQYIEGDSARPDTINEFRILGLNIGGVKKGNGSVEQGVKWLQDRPNIFIDKDRCPNTWREFRSYEYEYDQKGNRIPKYPDKNNHTIDAVRYSCVNYIKDRRIEAIQFPW